MIFTRRGKEKHNRDHHQKIEILKPYIDTSSLWDFTTVL